MRNALIASLFIALIAAGCEPPPAACPQVPTAAPTASAAPTTTATAATTAIAPEKRVSEPLPTSTPAAEGIDAAALDKLLSQAKATESDALVILRHGKLVGEWYFEKPRTPIESMSVTKSVVSLLIGALLTDGKIKSLDQPVSDYYPEWKQGKKKAITIRHLLNHTSGIQADHITTEIYASPDFLKLALAAELTSEPGERFFYNNKAVAILGGIIQIASGQRMDDYARQRLFNPLGIGETAWELDKAGNPQVMAGLSIHPIDLAKIGQLFLARGQWKGAQIIAASYIDEAGKRQYEGVPCGLLWWQVTDNEKRVMDEKTLAAWKAAGVSEKALKNLSKLKNKEFPVDAFREEVKKAFTKDELKTLDEKLMKQGAPFGKTASFEVVGWDANGYLGEWIVVLPKEDLVVVRMRRAPDSEAKEADRSLGLPDLEDLSRALIKKP